MGSQPAPALHVNRGPGPVLEVKREPAGERWCFGCRQRLMYELVVKRYDCDPLDDWYGPWPALECVRCHKDRALFPGYERTWGES